MKHTPGPWDVEPYQWDHGASLVIVQEGFIIARIEPIPDLQTVVDPDYDTVVRHEEDKPNARLIAAAPDLLSHLKWIVLVVETTGKVDHVTNEGMIEDINNLIAKTEGR